MIALPINAFCLIGNDGKIEIIINEIFDFPNRTSIAGGYDIKCSLIIQAGNYNVCCDDFYSSTGTLYNLLCSLTTCYDNLYGIAEYKHILENNLEFNIEMTKFGHATVTGSFQEYPSINNILSFEYETDQTCIKDAISQLKLITETFGDNTGIHI